MEADRGADIKLRIEVVDAVDSPECWHHEPERVTASSGGSSSDRRRGETTTFAPIAS
jgi:hypothetical protein